MAAWVLKAAESATWAGPHGRTADWALSGWAARTERVAQPKSLESQPQEARAVTLAEAAPHASSSLGSERQGSVRTPPTASQIRLQEAVVASRWHRQGGPSDMPWPRRWAGAAAAAADAWRTVRAAPRRQPSAAAAAAAAAAVAAAVPRSRSCCGETAPSGDAATGCWTPCRAAGYGPPRWTRARPRRARRRAARAGASLAEAARAAS